MTYSNIEKAPGALNTEGFEYDSDAGDFTGQSDERKMFATLCARFALAGHSLIRANGGSMFAIRWNQAKHLPDTGAALRFLQQIGGAA